MDETMYVVHSGSFPMGVSTDIRPLMEMAQDSVAKYTDPVEWDWQPDYAMKEKRLRLRYVSRRTGRWNSSDYYISTVKVLEAEK